MRIGDFEFEGPLNSPDELDDQPGLCVVIHVATSGACNLVWIDQAANVRTAVKRFIATPSLQNCTTEDRLKCGVRYVGNYSEEELGETLATLRNEYLVTCVL